MSAHQLTGSLFDLRVAIAAMKAATSFLCVATSMSSCFRGERR